MLTDRLQLTPQQVEQVRPILERQHEQFKALWQKARAQDGSTQQNVRAEMRTIRERTAQQIEGVLTDEQRATYRDLREEHSKKRGGDGRRHPGADRSRAGTA